MIELNIQDLKTVVKNDSLLEGERLVFFTEQMKQFMEKEFSEYVAECHQDGIPYISFATFNRYFSDWMYETHTNKNIENFRDHYRNGILHMNQMKILLTPYVSNVYQMKNRNSPHPVNTFIKLQ